MSLSAISCIALSQTKRPLENEMLLMLVPLALNWRPMPQTSGHVATRLETKSTILLWCLDVR
jgi:hypothetical protein